MNEPQELKRNDKHKQLQSNGPRRPGQYAWHNENCQVEIGETDLNYRIIWCATHGQWAHEIPLVRTYQYMDGTVIRKEYK